jgi:hypothetical protein
MFIDPVTVSWILFGAASLVAFIIGYNFNNHSKEEVIEETILYLIHNNFIRAKKVNDEWEIIELDKE